MASSSTSSIQKRIFRYDVFLSFRGEDTRKTFIGYLYDALKQGSIETYKDDIDLEKGKKISKELIQAITDSRFHVIVFSKNYASSSWCLDELVKIMECQKTMTGHTVYPIFYHVEPTHVRNQSGKFGKAFERHEKVEAAHRWRDALVEATSFSGWDTKTIANGQEIETIKIVVSEISLKLRSVDAAEDNLIGMTTQINPVVSSLSIFPDNLGMHDHIDKMGGHVVRGLHPHDPNRHSRLWIKKENFDILANNRVLDKPRFLQHNGSTLGILDLLPTLNIQCADLVELGMPRKFLQLKTMKLEGCGGLVKLDMTRECSQLITLDLNGCEDLLELHMPCECPQLKTLNLKGCRVW